MTSQTACTVSDTGISAPTYDALLTYFQTQYKAIYGPDVDLDADTQDGQFVAIIASAVNDANAATIAVYNSFSPSKASGAALASNVKINGISKNLASNSQVNVVIGGDVGTTIADGVIIDSINSARWDLPVSVSIPSAGTITVTATAQQSGALLAPAGTTTWRIGTPTRGWQTVTSAADASPGAAVELDAALRRRQADSVALPSLTVLDGLVGAVKAIDGVTMVQPFENDTDITDANGIPRKSVALVVQGGDATAIATAIMNKKTPGCLAYGSTIIDVTDNVGIVHAIGFSVPAAQRIVVAVQQHALSGYTSNVGTDQKQAIADYINALGIGVGVKVIRLIVPASLSGAADSLTYELVTVTAAIYGTTPGASDIAIAFNQVATCAVSDITITIV